MIAYARVSSAGGAQYVGQRRGWGEDGGKLRLEKSSVAISQYDHARGRLEVAVMPARNAANELDVDCGKT